MLVKGEYLGSTYSILLVRNTQDYSGEVSILCNEFINGIDGKKQYQVKSSASIPNIFISNLSLCGIPRLRKTYLVAVGSTFTSSASSSSNSSVGSQGVIQFLEVQSEKGSTIISPVASPKCDDATHFTDCTYQLDGEQLAVVNESGDLFLIDTSTGTYLHSLKADSSLKKVRYFPDSSMIATMSGSAMKIWDLRAPPSPSLSFSPEPIHHLRSLKNQHSPVQSNLASTPRSKALSISPPSLACFVCHASEPKIFLGDNRGAVNLWDYRMTSPLSRGNQLEYTPHNAAVNEVIVHPLNNRHIITASNDGSIREFDYLQVDARIATNNATLTNTLFQQPYGLHTIDVDEESSSLLITSQAGKFWNLPLTP